MIWPAIRAGDAPRKPTARIRTSFPKIGLAAIRGYQGPGPGLTPGHVFATAKHFAAHGPNEGGINTAPTQVPERELREELLWPFERAIREGHVAAVMPSYNEIDGVPSTASRFLLDKVLRQEWEFQGLVVSDYNAIEQLADRHGIAASMAEAAALALAAGVDLELPDRKANLTIVEEVRAGRLDAQLLDRAVARMLRLKFLAGLFEHPYADADEAERVTNTADAQAALRSMPRGLRSSCSRMTGALPLDRARVQTLAVIGPERRGLHLRRVQRRPWPGDEHSSGDQGQGGHRQSGVC